MGVSTYVIFSLIAFTASVVGAICGIGGGVLIKPILDSFGILSVSAISFLSGLTVLSMATYNVIQSKISGEDVIDKKTGTPLAIGAAFGGILGKMFFQIIMNMSADKDKVGAIQSLLLLIVTFGSLIYTINKDKIKTYNVEEKHWCILIGIALGIISSFLGIGGGPINLVVLYFFFSMETKMAAQNSLYIILFSQASSLLNTLVTHTVPEFEFGILVFMVISGILGGFIGRKVYKKIDSNIVVKLFNILMCIIMVICVGNIIKFM